MLLSKTFGQQADVDRQVPRCSTAARRAPDPPGDGRPLVLHDHRHDLLDHAGVRVLAGRLRWRSNGDPTRRRSATIVAFTTLQSRLFFPLGQLLNVQVEIQGVAGAVRPDLRVPRDGPGDRGRARCGRPRPGHGPRPGALPRRVVPLPDGGRALESRPRGRRDRDRGARCRTEAVAVGGRMAGADEIADLADGC